MNAIINTLILILLSTLSGCATQTDLTHIGDPLGEERRLLVAFADHTINRTLQGNSQDGYRVHGQYGSSSWSERQAQQLAERHHLRYVAQWPVTELGVSCVVYEVPSELSLQQALQNLQQDGEVELVQPMQQFKVLSEPQSKALNYSDPYLKLQNGFQSLGIANLHKTATGRGVRVAVIDTGVDLAHPDLKDQIHHLENVAPEPSDHNLADRHGTAVVGVLSALPNNGIGIAGIAPDAEILAFRACWPEKPGALAAHCNSFTLALALNMALRSECQIINLSLAGPEDPLMKRLVEKALKKGVVVVAAIAPEKPENSFPANMPGVIAVGNGGEPLANALYAPGRDILTTVPSQTYDFMSGSSFATPHVSGMIALFLQQNPTWRDLELRQQLHRYLNQANIAQSVN